MMKKQTLIAAGLLLAVMGGCTQGRQGADTAVATFASSAPAAAAPAQTATEDTDAGRQPVSVTTLDLLKQRVGKGVSEIMLTRKAYVTSYNKQTRTPNWVAWTLTKDHTYGSLQRQNERFEEDTDVPTPRATYQDFYNSRLDRGHMCPAGDNKWDATAMTESFLLTNICAQNHTLNKDDWNDLEMQCRTWARRFGEVTVVCGPLFEDEGQARTVGRNKVRVPSGFFKVVYRAKPQPHAVGFIFENSGKSQPWRQQVCSVDEVEQRSGINFFHLLPDDIENSVEAVASLQGW